MIRFATLVPALFLTAAPAFADSDDIAAGEKAFKKCKACHAIIADNGEGEVLFKGGKTGPNLWGLPGRQAGSYPGYKYSASLIAAGEAGLTWDEDTFEAFVQDPKKFLQSYLDDSKAKSKMTYRLKKGGEDVWAFIAGVSPAAEAEMEDASTETATD